MKTLLKAMTQSYCFAHRGMKNNIKNNFFFCFACIYFQNPITKKWTVTK